MKKRLLYLTTLIISLFSFSSAFAHSVQVAYCISCSGQLRLYVEHWHGNANPSSTTMTIQTTVDGVTSTMTGSPVANLQNIPFAQLPNCASPPVVFASCSQANTYNDWVVYDFPNIGVGASVQFRILSGNSFFTDDACGMFPATSPTFIVQPLNQPPITVNPVTTCSGTSAPGINFPPGNPSGGTYIWSNDNPSIGIPASGSGNIPSFNPPASSTTQVANITVSYLCATTQFTVTVLPSAGPNFNFVNIQNVALNGNPQVQCLGDTTQFTAQATPGVNIQSATWDFGDGTTSNVMNPSHLYANEGTYTTNLTVTTDGGCTQTSTSTITVHPKPVANFTSSPTCEHDAVTFTDASTITSGSITGWNWNFGDGNTSSLQNPSHQYGQDGTYPINLTVVSGVGCMNSTTGSQLIYEKPTASFASTNECLTDATQFTDNSTAIVALTNWDWDFLNDGSTDDVQQNPSYTFPNFGTPSVKLTVTDAHGCHDDTITTVTVYPLPVADFTSNEVCPTFNTLFTDNSTIAGGGTINQWIWDFNNDNSTESTAQNPSYAWGTGGTYDTKLTVVSTDGCSNTVIKQVTVYPKPVAQFSVDAVCHHNANTYTDASTVALGNSIVQWNWDFGDGNTDIMQNTTHTYANDGIFTTTLIVTSNNGCTDTVSHNTTVYVLPIASFTFSTECLNEATLLTDQTIFDVQPQSWAWDYTNDGTTDDTQQNTSFVYPNFGFHNVKLSVTDINGCMDDTIATIEVKPLPVADFSSTAECPFFPSSLTDLSSVPGGAIINQWSWDISDDGSVEYTTQNTTNSWNAGGTYYVELKVETADGCLDSVVKPVTIFPKPVADYNHTTVCFGTNTDFTDASTITLNNTITQWSWDFDDGQNSSQTNPSHLYGSHGIYDVTLMIETNNGCRDTVTKPVEVYAMPVPFFTMQNACEYETIDFTNLTTIPSQDNITYLWNFGDNLMGAVENPEHNYSMEGTYNVTLTATSSNGCIADTTLPIEIYDEPFAQFSLSNGCVYEDFTFNDLSNTTSTINTWEWSFDDGSTSNAQSPVHHFASEGIYNITLVTTTTENCSDTNTIALEVYPKPAANFTPTDVCLNTPTVFEDVSAVSTSVFPNETILQYSIWEFGDGTTANGHTVTHTYQNAGTYNSQMIATTFHGCKDTAYLYVVVHNNPVAYFSVLDSVGCNPVTANFVNQSSIVNYPLNYSLSYLWYFDNGEISSAENPSSTFYNEDHEDNENYGASLVVTSNYGCKDSIYRDNIITVYPIPLADFSFTPEEADIYDANVQFTDLSLGASSWNWSFGDGYSDSTQNPMHNYADSGYYNVNLTVTSAYDCSNGTSKTFHVKPAFNIYIPNSITPNGDGKNDVFLVRGYGITDMEMYIYDKWGQLIYEGFSKDQGWDGRKKGKMQETAVYVYLIKVTDLNDENHIFKGSLTVVY